MPGWFLFCLGRAGRQKGVGDSILLPRWKDAPEVAILPSSEVSLNQRRVHFKELVALSDCFVIGLFRVLEE